MKKHSILFVILSLVVCAGCYNEDALTPTTELEPGYVLPNNGLACDAEIAEYYKKCGFYILYDFEPKDIYWNLTRWEGLTWDTPNERWDQNTFYASPAEQEYVDRQFNLVKENLLNFYPDSTLAAWMPMKLLLCDTIWRPRGLDTVYQICREGFDYVAVAYGNQTVGQLTTADIDTLRMELNVMFLQKAVESGKMAIPEEFASISVYGDSETTTSNMYSKGFICPDDPTFGTYITVESDWSAFIEAIVSTHENDLKAIPDLMEIWGMSDPTYIGILYQDDGMNEIKDVTGNILKKYNIVINYFKDNFGIDLQAIGNMMPERAMSNSGDDWVWEW